MCTGKLLKLVFNYYAVKVYKCIKNIFYLLYLNRKETKISNNPPSMSNSVVVVLKRYKKKQNKVERITVQNRNN